MPGAIVHFGAIVICAHGGQAVPPLPVTRVLVSGQPIATVTTPYLIIQCPFIPPAPGPCVTGQWTVGAVRVMAMGQPVAIQTGTAICAPTGAPMLPLVVQERVIAT